MCCVSGTEGRSRSTKTISGACIVGVHKTKERRRRNGDPIDEIVRRSERWWEPLLPARPGQRSWLSDMPPSSAQERRIFAAVLILAGVGGAVLSWRVQRIGISLALSLLVVIAGVLLTLARDR